MAWKALFWILASFIVFGLLLMPTMPLNISGLAHIPLQALGLLGLYGYAFHRRILRSGLRKVVGLVTLIVIPLDLIILVTNARALGAPLALAIGTWLITAGANSAVAVALLRYSRSLANEDATAAN